MDFSSFTPFALRKLVLLYLSQLVRYLALSLLFMLIPATCLLGQRNDYEPQFSLIEAMLNDGQFRAASKQAEGLVNSAHQAKLPLLEAEALYLLGLARIRDPAATSQDQIEAVEQLRSAARIFERQRQPEMVDSVAATIRSITESGELPAARVTRLTRTTKRRGRFTPHVDSIDESALEAIVNLQNAEIMALTDSQLRHLFILEQQDRLLDDYAFQALEDSLMLMEQDRQIAVQALVVKQEQQRRNFLTLLAVASILLLILLYLRFRSSRKHQTRLEAQNAIIARERHRSDELLLNILPGPIAEELKENGKATTRSYESATILFMDFVGFSALAKRLPPERLIALLDEAFQEIDRIVTEHGVEKIKTIGDAYMCVGGVPIAVEDHAARTVRAALAMQRYLDTNEHFSARIGIHSGPVVAGVVGLKKFIFDVWGDAVNQAARLESAGEPGRVAISEATRALLPEGFKTEAAGTIEAKNIGLMKRFFIV